MSNPSAIVTFVSKRMAVATLISSAAATTFTTLIGAPSFSFDVWSQNLVSIGAPVALGAAIVNWTIPKQGSGTDLNTANMLRAVVGGGATCAVLILAGVMPREVNSELLTLWGITAGSIFVGDFMAESVF